MKYAVHKLTLGALVLASIYAAAQPPSAFMRDQSKPAAQVSPDDLKNVGIDQRLDQQVPLELEFKDETGKTVKLGDYFQSGRPVILNLVYYTCPMLCGEDARKNQSSQRQLVNCVLHNLLSS